MKRSLFLPAFKMPGSAVLMALALFAALAAGCGSADGRGTWDKIEARGVIRVGYANEAPYAYLDPQQNRLTGEAPEIARILLARLGVAEIEGVLTEFGSLIPGLKAGRFDMIAAGMYITPERCREIAFSNPTYQMREAFIVRAGNPKKLHSYEDVVANGEVRLGLVSGTMEGRYAEAVGIPARQISMFPDVPSALSGISASRVDAFAGTALTVQDMLTKANDSGLERADPFTGPVIQGKEAIGYGAFAFRKEDQTLRQRINGELASFIGSADHLQAVRPFGFGPDHLPGPARAKALCQAPGGPA